MYSSIKTFKKEKIITGIISLDVSSRNPETSNGKDCAPLKAPGEKVLPTFLLDSSVCCQDLAVLHKDMHLSDFCLSPHVAFSLVSSLSF